MNPIRTILVATDFSPGSDPALEVARGLARDHGALLTLITVPPLPPPPYRYPFPPGQAEYACAVERAKRQLQTLVNTIDDVPVARVVTSGPPAIGILTAAKDHNADLIVMGTHGRTGAARWVLGSVAEEVMRLAPCPVLTIRSKLTPTSREEIAPQAVMPGDPSFVNGSPTTSIPRERGEHHVEHS